MTPYNTPNDPKSYKNYLHSVCDQLCDYGRPEDVIKICVHVQTNLVVPHFFETCF